MPSCRYATQETQDPIKAKLLLHHNWRGMSGRMSLHEAGIQPTLTRRAPLMRHNVWHEPNQQDTQRPPSILVRKTTSEGNLLAQSCTARTRKISNRFNPQGRRHKWTQPPKILELFCPQVTHVPSPQHASTSTVGHNTRLKSTMTRSHGSNSVVNPPCKAHLVSWAAITWKFRTFDKKGF